MALEDALALAHQFRGETRWHDQLAARLRMVLRQLGFMPVGHQEDAHR